MNIEHKDLYIKTLESKVSELEMNSNVNKRLKMIKAYFFKKEGIVLTNSDVMHKLLLLSHMWKIKNPVLENVSEMRENDTSELV